MSDLRTPFFCLRSGDKIIDKYMRETIWKGHETHLELALEDDGTYKIILIGVDLADDGLG